MIFVKNFFKCVALSACFCALHLFGEGGEKEDKASIQVSSKQDVSFEQIFEESSKSIATFTEQFGKNLAKYPQKPLLQISIQSIPQCVQLLLKLTENYVPGMLPMASMFTDHFLGGTQCKGISSEDRCYLQLFPYQATVAPVFFFKAFESSPLVVTFSSLGKDEGYNLKSIAPIEKDKAHWWVYGPSPLINDLMKNVYKTAPFLSKKETNPSFLHIDLPAQTLELGLALPVLKNIYNTFVKDHIESFAYDINPVEKGLDIAMRYQVLPNSIYLPFFNQLNDALKQHRVLDWSSEEDVKTLEFVHFNGIKTFLTSAFNQMNGSSWSADALSKCIYQWCELCLPLIQELCDFGDKNLAGNVQSYANILQEKGRVSTLGFGFLQGKECLTNESLLAFLIPFFQTTLKKQLQSALNQNILGSEWIHFLSYAFDKNILIHNQCVVHGFSWRLAISAAPKQAIQYPILLSVCKGYLLYADNIEDMKRLIDRFQAMKSFSYCEKPEVLSQSTFNFAKVYPFPLFDGNAFLSTEVKINLQEKSLRTNVHIPLNINPTMLQNMNKILTSEEKPSVETSERKN